MDAPPNSPNYRRYALALLLAVNLLNYIDRQVLYAVFPLIKADLRISDTALGLLGSAFMLCYMLSAQLLGWLGDRLQKKSGRGYLLVSGWGFLIGTPIAVWAIVAPTLTGCLTAIFLAEFFLFLNTVINSVTQPTVRAMAFAINIFFIHALGDAVSPSILGRFSDFWGLKSALLITPGAMALAGFFCFICGRHMEDDMVRAEGATHTYIR